MEKYYITRWQPKANHAGSKAVGDSEIILNKNGFNEIGIYPRRDGNKFVRKIVNYRSLNLIKELPPNSIVIVEHPLYISETYMDVLVKTKAKKNIKLIFLIHDFETIRGLFPDNTSIRKVEKKILHYSDYLIVHNGFMADYFTEKFGVDPNKMVVLELFDYLCSDLKKTKELDFTFRSLEIDNTVVIAGNLNSAKCGYIYKLVNDNLQVKFNLYGVNLEKNMISDNCVYKGAVDADSLPDVIKGKYGLVWDGPSIDCCTGATGEYLRVNNPHKVSLYIASGLPIIIWKEAALAKLVLEYNIGFVVDKLEEINERLNNISSEEYNNFIENITELSKKVRTGFFLEKALIEIERKIIE